MLMLILQTDIYKNGKWMYDVHDKYNNYTCLYYPFQEVGGCEKVSFLSQKVHIVILPMVSFLILYCFCFVMQ